MVDGWLPWLPTPCRYACIDSDYRHQTMGEFRHTMRARNDIYLKNEFGEDVDVSIAAVICRKIVLPKLPITCAFGSYRTLHPLP